MANSLSKQNAAVMLCNKSKIAFGTIRATILLPIARTDVAIIITLVNRCFRQSGQYFSETVTSAKTNVLRSKSTLCSCL
ncbi:unnamed protein product [Albugo candida]|uniref:Uncharacterized protein n=1 Tax=Albugo candida TaxID=65357 RepID=A0A024FT98_9STRA|nr:unnamed protein product [Albugo candida]|eukprot:CCI10318.1 unnamed protein product [Albugo candida]